MNHSERMTEQERYVVTKNDELYVVVDTVDYVSIAKHMYLPNAIHLADYLNVLDKEKEQLREENEKLKQENKRLKEILKIKRNEIIKRVLALQEITDKYTNEVLFKNNVNPNDAVKQVLEILSSKVI